MDEIQDLLLLPYFKGVSFVPRSANLATHTLLGWALSIGQGGVGSLCLPLGYLLSFWAMLLFSEVVFPLKKRFFFF